MNIILNNTPATLPHDNMSLEDLITWKGWKREGTAIAVNDILITREKWKLTKLSNLDRVTVITAAFGG
ncbi:MAG: sulfur carrier protein ThiS [Muribaculaceae bacterium]|nr:sulfur carrier protein ThiS [Muribaculaceae bacterium]